MRTKIIAAVLSVGVAALGWFAWEQSRAASRAEEERRAAIARLDEMETLRRAEFERAASVFALADSQAKARTQALAAAKERDREELRRFAPLVLAFGNKQYAHGNGIKIVDSQPLNAEGSRIFLVAIQPFEMYNRATRETEYIAPDSSDSFLRTIFVNRGELIEKIDEEDRWWWHTMEPEQIALRYGRHDYPDTDFEVERVKATAIGSLDAVLVRRDTGRRYRLQVRNYSSDLVPAD